jgi:hypothetical protein
MQWGEYPVPHLAIDVLRRVDAVLPDRDVVAKDLRLPGRPSFFLGLH